MILSYYNSEYHVGYTDTRKTDCDGVPLYKFYIFKATGFDKYDTVEVEYRYTWNIRETIYNIMQKIILE